MPSFFDDYSQYLKPTDDEKNKAQALMAATIGAGLLGARKGQEAPAIGNAIQQGLLGYQQNMSKYSDPARLKLALEMKKIAQDNQNKQWLSQFATPMSPTQALASGGGPTIDNAAKIGTVPSFGVNEFRQGLAKGIDSKMLDDFNVGGRPEVKEYLKADTPNGSQYYAADKYGTVSPTNLNVGKELPWYAQKAGGRISLDPAYTSFELNKARSGATTNKIDIKTGEAFGGKAPGIVEDSLKSALNANNMMRSAEQIDKALSANSLFTGTLANTRLKLAQLADTMGVAGKDTQEKILNTRMAIKGLAEIGIAARSQLGSQAQISNYEQQALERATGGNIDDMTNRELQYVVNVAKRNAPLITQRHKGLVDKMRSNAATAGLADYYDVPDYTPSDIGNQNPSSSMPPPGAVRRIK